MAIWRILCGDLKRVIKDKMAALWMVVMPILFAFIFGQAFRGGGSQATWIPIIDLDHTDLSALFIDQVRQDGYWIEVFGPDKQADLKTKWPYGVVIPPDFAHQILAGKPLKLTVVKGNGAPDKLLEVQSCLTQAIVHFTKGLALADTSHHAWNPEAKASLQNALARPQLLTVSVQTDRSLRPPPLGFSLSLPGMLIMFVMQMMITFGGTTLVADRTKGQFVRLVAAPIYAVELYAGKILARIVLAMLQASLVLFCGALLFQVPLGDYPLYLIPVVLSLAAFAGCLSILCGLVCQTEKQVVQIAIFATLILASLGGCWWPIEVVPDLFKTIATFTPTYWGVRGLQSVLYFGKSYQVLTLECPILLGFAVCFILLTIPFARKLARRGPVGG